MSSSNMRIVVSGMIAADPFQGGATWAVLQYVLGLRQLGHDVLFVEPVKATSIRPSGAPLGDSTNAAYFRQVVAEFGFAADAALLKHGGRDTVGVSYDELLRRIARADVLINISGLLDDAALTQTIPVRAYLDLDPAFNQLWSAQGID